MKRILLFLMLGYSSGTFAQEMRPLPSLFEVTGAPAANVRSSSNGGKMGVMMANPMNKEIRKVKFADLHKMAFEGKLDKASPAHFEISIPKGRGTDAIKSVLAIPKYIEVKPNGDYEYSADLVKSKSDRGHIIIIHQGGKNFGSMTFNDRTFRMESDAVEGDILIEIDKKILDSPTSCGTSNFTQNDKKTGSNKTLPDLSGLASRAAANGSCEVRVLVLFTDNAARVSNPAQLAPTFIAETNTALRNSGIAATHLNFVLAGTQRVVFNDRFSINADLVLPRAVTDTNIAALRAQNRADLVIVLTDGNYEARSELNVLLGSVLGIATLDEYSFANTGHMALVEADASGFTFAHEVGHLMGAKHDNDLRTIGNPTAGLRLPPALTESAKGKTWFIRDCFICGRRDRKSMVAHGNTIGIRTPYFSNPAVTEPRGRSATGAADRNNFAQLLRAAPVVSGYDNTPALIVGISGPGSVQLFTNYTLTASVQNCAGSTFRWERSENGFTYSPAGTASSIRSTALPVPGNIVYFRLTVSCSNGQSRTVTTTVLITGDPGGPMQLQAILPATDEVAATETSATQGFVMYPNQATTDVNVTGDFGDEEKVKVTLYGISPMNLEKRLYNSRVSKGSQTVTLDVSNVPQGLYQLVVTANGKVLFGNRLVISRIN